RLDDRFGAFDERYFRCAKAGQAHVDAHFSVGRHFRNDYSAGGLDADAPRLRITAIANEPDEAARAVAALLDLKAVGVPDPVAEISVGASGFFDDEHLIAAHS